MTPRPRNATFAIAAGPFEERAGEREASRSAPERRQTAVVRRLSLGVEGEMLRADAVVGAVGDHGVDGAVEQRLERPVILAQPDRDACGVEGGVERSVADRSAALPFRALEELGERQLVGEHEIDPLGEEIEIGFLEIAVGLDLGLRVALLEETRVLAV